MGIKREFSRFFREKSVSKKSYVLFFATLLAFSAVFVGFNLSILGFNEVLGQSSDSETYDSIVIFRNDDVSKNDTAFHEFNNLFERNQVPVTHAIIPHRVLNQNDNPKEQCSQFRELRRNSNVDIDFAAHGYNGSRAEFLNTNNQFNKLDSIHDTYNFCLDQPPKVFVPPDNIHKSNLPHYLKKFDYNVLSAAEKSLWQENKVNLKRSYFEEFERESPVIRLGKTHRLVDNWDPVTFKEREELFSNLNNSIDDGEIIVQVTHYQPIMDKGAQELLNKTIKFLKQKDVKFMTFQQVYNKLGEEKIRSKGDEWIVNQ